MNSSKDANYDIAMAIAAYFTARTASETIRDELQSGDEDFALRMVIAAIADFREIIAKDDTQAIKDFLVEPKSTGSIRWDTLLAASIGRECRLAGPNRPAWTYPKPLDTWWFVDPTPVLMARNILRTAPELECVGIWLNRNAFETA